MQNKQFVQSTLKVIASENIDITTDLASSPEKTIAQLLTETDNDEKEKDQPAASGRE